MRTTISPEEALTIVEKYNKEPFHIRHAITVSEVLGNLATVLGYGDESAYWASVGMLHDVDFELYPEIHLQNTPDILKKEGLSDDVIHAVMSHGYGHCSDVEPEHEMEKVLYATDELTGLIGAVALMRPSKSVQDMELKSVKKKYKNEKFAAGCSRKVIEDGAEMLGWDLDKLIEETIIAMRVDEKNIQDFMSSL